MLLRSLKSNHIPRWFVGELWWQLGSVCCESCRLVNFAKLRGIFSPEVIPSLRTAIVWWPCAENVRRNSHHYQPLFSWHFYDNHPACGRSPQSVVYLRALMINALKDGAAFSFLFLFKQCGEGGTTTTASALRKATHHITPECVCAGTRCAFCVRAKAYFTANENTTIK